jgi:hypothetical protein
MLFANKRIFTFIGALGARNLIISPALLQLMALHGYTITSDGTTGKLSMLNALALVLLTLVLRIETIPQRQ